MYILYKMWTWLPLQDARTANAPLAVGQEERFFNKLEDDVSRIIQQEKRREQYTNSHGHEVNTCTEPELVSSPAWSAAQQMLPTCRKMPRERWSLEVFACISIWVLVSHQMSFVPLK